MSDLKYPIAFNKVKNCIVESKNVDPADRQNCICIECEEPMTVVNSEAGEVRSHFKHRPGSNHSGNFETYIHKLCKYLFQELKSIKLPSFSEYIIQNESKYFGKRYKYFKSLNVSYEIQDRLLYSNFLPKEDLSLGIDLISIEEPISGDFGTFVPDIKVKSKLGDIFIEPFLTSKIDSKKAIKIREYGVMTLSIDLSRFINKEKYLFSKRKLMNFLEIDTESKKWHFVSTESIKKDLNADRLAVKNILNELESIDNKFATYQNEEEKIREKIEGLQKNLNELSKKKNHLLDTISSK